MGKTRLFDALSKVDEEHIESSLKRTENAEKAENSGHSENETPMRRPFIKRPVGVALSVAAACVVIAAVVLAAVFVPPAVRRSEEEKDRSDKTLVFEDVTLLRIDGQWSISINDEKYKETPPIQIPSPPWTFDSLDELITKIRTGSFTKGEIARMQREFEQNENGVILFDIDNPARPFFPEEYTLQKIYWYGSSYSAVLVDKDKTVVQLFWQAGDSDFVNDFDMKDYLDGIVAEDSVFTYGEPATSSDLKTVRIGTAGNTDKVKKLSIYEPMKNVFVFEEYRYRNNTLEPTPSPEPVRDTSGTALPAETPSPEKAENAGTAAAMSNVRYIIRVFYFEGDVKWILTSSNADHPFSVEEILSFGFKR